MVSSSATGVGGATIAGLSVDGTTYTDAPGGLVDWCFSNPDYASQNGEATVTISQVGSTVTVTPAANSATYDTLQHGATATWASSGTDGEGGSLTVTYAGIDGTDYASSTTAPTDVGEYQASASFAGNTDHTGSSNTADFAISPATATITVTGFSGGYDGEPHGVASSSATGVGGATIAGLSVDGTTYTDAPGGLVDWSFSNPDYASQNGEATVTISQVGSTVTVTPASSSVTYDAEQHGATAAWASSGTDGAGGSLTVTYVGIDGTDYASSTTAPTDVGEYQASASFAGNTDHTGSSNTADFAITQATATIAVTGFSGAYDGEPHSVVSGSATGVGGATIAGLSVDGTTYTDAPGGLVDWSFSNPDYASQNGEATVTISQVGSTVTVAGREQRDLRRGAAWRDGGLGQQRNGRRGRVADGDLRGHRRHGLRVLDDGPHGRRRVPGLGQLRRQHGPHGEQQHGRLRHHPGHGHDHGYGFQRRV